MWIYSTARSPHRPRIPSQPDGASCCPCPLCHLLFEFGSTVSIRFGRRAGGQRPSAGALRSAPAPFSPWATGRRPTTRPLTAGRQRPERCPGGGIRTPPRRRKRRDGDPRASIFRTVHASDALRPDSPGEGAPWTDRPTCPSARPSPSSARLIHKSTGSLARSPAPTPFYRRL